MAKKKLKLTYPSIIALGFFFVILTGTILLMLPISSKNGQSAGLMVSLFTATSSTCVTGLVLVDTFTQWTLFGQVIIIALIQTGGLGFMTILTLFSFVLKRRIGLTERSLLRESINTLYIGGVVRLTRKILYGTLFIEGIGAFILSFRFIPMLGIKSGVFTSIFTAISAFCNAGFDLMGRYQPFSSLTLVQNDVVINVVVMLLIMIGGIGFFVWDDVSLHKFHIRKYKIHTKIVLMTTFIITILGTFLFYMFEHDGVAMEGMNTGQKIMASMFSSVTPRTAGFNTIDTASLTPGSKLLTNLYMFIGGSPGSTAGGIKTTTLAVIFISVWANIRNNSGSNVFRRRLEDSALPRAVSVTMINLSLVLVCTLIMTFLQPNLHSPDVFIETFSAMGTVGMSTGITRELVPLSKILLIILMYCGRVGSLSFALIFTERRTKSPLQNPYEKVILG